MPAWNGFPPAASHGVAQALFDRFCERTGRAVDRADVFSATAARMSAFNAFSSILSPSWISMARLTLPSRRELKRPEGSSNAAPLAKVIFTTALKDSDNNHEKEQDRLD